MQWIREHAKPLVVRANVVRRALIWLKEHNPLYAEVQLNHEVLNSIEEQGGLPYHVEYADDDKMSTACISSYTPHVRDDSPMVNTHCPEIPFENVILTDFDEAATPNDMRAAALRHLQNGKAFLMYGHSPAPEREYHNPKLFPSLYPTLFPYGEGGFDDNRRHPIISMKAQAHHFLNIADNRFRVHPSFIFSVFNVLQRREVVQRTSMRVGLSSFQSKAQVYARLQPESIQRVADQFEKGDTNFIHQDEKDVLQLMRDVHLVNSTVMGSGAARLKMRNEIRALIATLGAPSFFITINPADVYNPVLKLLAGDEIDIDNLLPEHVPNYHQQSILIARDPVLAARFFDIYMKAFFSAVLRVDHTHGNDITPSILGVTKGYYGIVEAQGRGSLHCHMLVWLEGGLCPTEIRERILADPDGLFEKTLISYIEENIYTAVPEDPGDVPDVPSSRHHPCSVRPVLPRDSESPEIYDLRQRKDLFNLTTQCQIHRHNAGCYKNSTGAQKVCRFNLDEAKRIERTSIDRETGEINFRCLDGMVNQYNMALLEMLRCNMDIKFIGSGHSALAVLYYITDYISKTQLKTHTAYNALEMALNRLNEFGTTNESDDVRSPKLLLKCANAIISKQELSAQQVASYLLDNGDHYTSHRFKEFYWKSYENYVLHCIANDPALRDTMDTDLDITATHSTNESPRTTAMLDSPNTDPESDDDVHSESFGERVLMDPLVQCNESVTVSVDKHGHLVPKANHVAHYVYRPAVMKDMCLWDFLSFTDVIRCRTRTKPVSSDDEDSSDGSSDDSSDDDDTEDLLLDGSQSSFTEAIFHATLASSNWKFLTMHPSSKTHQLHILKPQDMLVLIPTGPPIPRRDRPEDHEAYCRLMLIFFKPWTSPTDLKTRGLSWSDCYDEFVQSEDILYEHFQIMKNLQFLHECRDSRDRESVRRRLSKELQGLTSIEATDIDHVDTDLSGSPDHIAFRDMEEQHAELLRDILRHQAANDGNILECLTALSLGQLSSHVNPAPPADVSSRANDEELVNLASADNDIQIREWKALYTTRRKTVKLSLQQNDEASHSRTNTSAALSLTGINQLNLNDFDVQSLAHSGAPSSEPGSSSHANDIPPSFESICDAICAHWTLNRDQRRAFNIVAKHVNSGKSEKPLTMVLSGPAGSGKSQVIKALRQLFEVRRENRRFRVASYMGIAANNVAGLTLHSALNIVPGSRLANDSSEELMYMWMGVDYLFIDEMSMISCEFLYTISSILCRATGRKEPFGGLSVIFAGDMAQLPPVAETRLYAYLDPSANPGSDKFQQKVKGRLLWMSISIVVVLHRINRQSGDENARFVELLNRLRVGECNGSDYRLLESRVISPSLLR